MSFIKKRIGHDKSFGQDLKELRELRGWTREQLEHATNIHRDIIKKLEEEDFKDLDDLVYVEKYIRAIAKALDGRAPFLIGKYRELLNFKKIDRYQNKKQIFIKKISIKELLVINKYFSVFFLFTILFLLSLYVWWQINLFTTQPKLIISQPIDYSHVYKSNIRIIGQTNPNTTVLINGVSVIVQKDGQFNHNLDLSRGNNKIEIIAQRPQGSETKIIKYVVYDLPKDFDLK